jgi:hypothetical protein
MGNVKSINDMAAWLEVNDHDDLTADGYLTNIVEQNNGREPRSTRYVVRKAVGSLERTVNVNQAGRGLYVQFDGSPYSVAATDTSVLIHGRTNAETLNFAIQETGTNVFITLDSNGYKLYESGGSAVGSYIAFGSGPSGDPGADGEWEFCLLVTLSENTGLSPRTNHVVATASATGYTSVTATAEITQGAGEAYLELSVGAEGTHSTTGVTISFDWEGNPTTGSDDDVYVWSNGTWQIAPLD